MIFGISASKIWLSIGQTLYMVGFSLLAGLLIAFPLAILLFLTRSGGIKQNRIVYNIISSIINIIRLVPFIILIVYIMPFTKAVVGTRVGSTAALVPLTVYIAPYLARLIENALFETDKGIIEASQALGATAMAGAVGGGGVGDLALTYGYQRFNTPLMTSTVVILIVFVQLIQVIGSRAAKKR